MKYSTDKDMDHFIRKLLREGWSYQRGRKHGRLVDKIIHLSPI